MLEELIHLAAVPAAPWLCQHPEPDVPHCTALLYASLRAQLWFKTNPQDEMDSENRVRETSAGIWEGSAVLKQFVGHRETSPVLCAQRDWLLEEPPALHEVMALLRLWGTRF